MPENVNDNDLRIRSAYRDDVFLLWQWANDPVTRRNSFNPEPIPWLTHEAWYLDRLSSPDCRLWVLEVGAEPVGQIRYDRTEPDAAQISFSIAPSFRHRNLGAKLLCLSTDLAGRELGVKYVQGVTFEDNVASVKAFKKAGFELAEQKKLAGHACLVFRRACRVKSVGDLGHVVY